MAKCGCKCEIYSRVTGYLRPLANWNRGKKEEFKDRLKYKTTYEANNINKKYA